MHGGQTPGNGGSKTSRFAKQNQNRETLAERFQYFAGIIIPVKFWNRFASKLFTITEKRWNHSTNKMLESFNLLGPLDCYNQHDTTCQLLNIDTFNEKSPSIMFADTFSGRFGNQLLGYVVLYQLQLQTGIKCYITKETKDFLLKFFTPESVTLSVFNETFCNWKRIHFKPYGGHFAGKILSL